MTKEKTTMKGLSSYKFLVFWSWFCLISGLILSTIFAIGLAVSINKFKYLNADVLLYLELTIATLIASLVAFSLFNVICAIYHKLYLEKQL